MAKKAKTEREHRLDRIRAIATNTLASEEAAEKWLSRPQRGLGGRIPIEMAETEEGAKEVERLLGRIEYGVLS